MQHERTTLAWERTAIAMMAAGTLLARYAASDGFALLAVFGLGEVMLGAGVLVWAGWHYDDLHGRVRAGHDLVFPGVVRLLGATTVLFTASAMALTLFLWWQGAS